jgi:hypothetical protein
MVAWCMVRGMLRQRPKRRSRRCSRPSRGQDRAGTGAAQALRRCRGGRRVVVTVATAAGGPPARQPGSANPVSRWAAPRARLQPGWDGQAACFGRALRQQGAGEAGGAGGLVPAGRERGAGAKKAGTVKARPF